MFGKADVSALIQKYMRACGYVVDDKAAERIAELMMETDDYTSYDELYRNIEAARLILVSDEFRNEPLFGIMCKEFNLPYRPELRECIVGNIVSVPVEMRGAFIFYVNTRERKIEDFQVVPTTYTEAYRHCLEKMGGEKTGGVGWGPWFLAVCVGLAAVYAFRRR